MNKSKLTRTLMAAVSVVALSAVMYGCVHSGNDAPAVDMDALKREQSEAQAAASAAAKALADVEADKAADMASYDKAMAASADAAAANTSAQAATTVEDATKYSDMAAAAKADAEKYAGMVATAAGEVDDAQAAAAAAAKAARMAATDAVSAVAAVTADKSHDPSAYAIAVVARDNADAAADAAEAANTAAQAAQTPAAAKAQQAVAEAAQGNAEAALQTAQDNADMVAAAKQQAENEATAEAQALADARTAAATAASEAAAALTAANTALEGLAEIASADTDSYAKAMAAQMAAKAASDAAAAANQAAMLASNSAQAKLQQAIAEREQGKAEDAQADAEKYATMVRDAKTAQDEKDAADKLAQDLQDARLAATEARMKAQEAAAKAATARDTLVDTDGATPDEISAASDAKAAADAAVLVAIAAELEASQADTLADAQAAQKKAEDAQKTAEAELGNINMAQSGINERNDEAAAELTALMDARDAAKMAAMEAKTAETDAETAADDAETAADDAEAAAARVEELAPGSTSATAARTAAMAARTAAMAARAAADAATAARELADTAAMDAQDAETSEDAEAAQERAETARGVAQTQKGTADTQKTTAEGQYNTANALKESAEQAEDVVDRNARDLAVTAAMDYWEAAKLHVAAALKAKNDADTDADNAEADATKAMKARTDYANAKVAADDARTAADDAEDAYDDAVTAAGNAEAAYMAAKATQTMDAGDDADMLRSAAKMQREKAEAERDKAKMHKMTAEEKEGEAEGHAETAMEEAADAAKYAGVHVLGLLIHANAQDILDVEQDVITAPAVMRARDARLKAVSGAINNAAGMHDAASTDLGDRDQDSSTVDTDTSNASATSMWPADTPDDPETTEDESMEGMLSIAVAIDDTATNNLVFRTAAAEEDNADTADIDETIVTATKLDPGLGSFVGYSISDRNRHAIAFTDKQQGTPAVTVVAYIEAQELVDDPVTGNTITDVGTRSGTGYTGVTYYVGTVAADTDPDTAFMGRLNCPSPAPTEGCLVEHNEDGTITVTGFRFTGSRAERAAVEAADAAENDDYLAFGIWLIEDGDADTEGNQPSFAAFANGGEPIADFATYVTLTGTASYSGNAAGVYTQGDSVDWFEGDASLTANFGAPGTAADPEAADDEIGTVSGTISRIMAGGVATGDVISLRSANIVNENTAFSGSARMGPGVDTDDDDVLEYTYNGTWSGNFYGAVAAVPDDTATANIDESMDAAAPEAVAGTFGVSGTMGEGDAAVTTTYVGAFGARR